MKRLLATILTFVLVVSMIPSRSFASEGPVEEPQIVQDVNEGQDVTVPEVTQTTDDSNEPIETEQIETDTIKTDPIEPDNSKADNTETQSTEPEQPIAEDSLKDVAALQDILPSGENAGDADPYFAGSVSTPAVSDNEELSLGGYEYHFDENLFEITNNLDEGSFEDGFEGSFDYNTSYDDGFQTIISAKGDVPNDLQAILITKYWYADNDPNYHMSIPLYPFLAKEAYNHTWEFELIDHNDDDNLKMQGSLVYNPDTDTFSLNIYEEFVWGFYNIDFMTEMPAGKIRAEYDDSNGFLQVTQYHGENQVGETATLHYGEEVDRFSEDGNDTDRYVFTVISDDTDEITTPYLFYACISNGTDINLSDKAVVSGDGINYELKLSDYPEIGEYDDITIQFVMTEDEYNYYSLRRQENQIELDVNMDGPRCYTIDAEYVKSEAFVEEAWYKGNGRILFDREKLAGIGDGLPMTFYVDDSTAPLTELGYDDRGDEEIEIDEAHKTFTIHVTAERDDHNLWMRFGANPYWRTIRFDYNDDEVKDVEYQADSSGFTEYFHNQELYQKDEEDSGDFASSLVFRFKLREDEHDDPEDPDRVTREFTLNGIKVDKNVYFADPIYISADEIEYDDGWYYITVVEDQDDGLSANYFISTGGDLFTNQYEVNYSKGQDDGRYHDQNSGKVYTGVKHDDQEIWDWKNPIYYGDKDWRFHYDNGDEILLDLTPPDYLDQKDVKVRVIVSDDNRELAKAIIEPVTAARNQVQWRYSYQTTNNQPLRFEVYWTDAEYAFDQAHGEDRQYTLQLTNFGVSDAVIVKDDTFVNQTGYQDRTRYIFDYVCKEGEDDWWNNRQSHPITIELKAKKGFEGTAPINITYDGDYRINEEGEADRLHNDHPELEYKVENGKYYLILDAARCDNDWINIEVTYPYALTYDLNYEGAPAFGTPTYFEENLRLTDDPDAREDWAEIMEEGSIPIGEKAPSREGYQFGGWYFADGSRCWFMSWNWDEINHSETLYARWNANRYTIKYVVDGAPYTDTLNRSEYYYDDANIALKNPSKTGYTFSGWYEDSAMTKPVTQIASGSTGNKTYYGKFTYSKYTIAFNANGGKGTMASLSCQYGTSKTLTANAFTRTGYTFAGWSKTAGGAVAYKNGASVLNLTSTNGATVTLYAKWTANTYTVKFNANKGKGKMAAKKYTYDKAATLTANKFTRKGYKFTGWSTTKKGKVKYKNKASVKNLVSTSGGSITLYAVWKKK